MSIPVLLYTGSMSSPVPFNTGSMSTVLFHTGSMSTPVKFDTGSILLYYFTQELCFLLTYAPFYPESMYTPVLFYIERTAHSFGRGAIQGDDLCPAVH